MRRRMRMRRRRIIIWTHSICVLRHCLHICQAFIKQNQSGDFLINFDLIGLCQKHHHDHHYDHRHNDDDDHHDHQHRNSDTFDGNYWMGVRYILEEMCSRLHGSHHLLHPNRCNEDVEKTLKHWEGRRWEDGRVESFRMGGRGVEGQEVSSRQNPVAAPIHSEE